jgi:deoxyribodipyrimidine photo-lyase
MHNRCRMITAMFLTKVSSLSSSNQLSFESVLTTALQDLMLDWRLGEKWFMENLIDGDLGSK